MGIVVEVKSEAPLPMARDGDGPPVSPDVLLPQARALYDQQVARNKRYSNGIPKDFVVPVVINTKYLQLGHFLTFDMENPTRSYMRFAEASRRWTLEDAEQALATDAEITKGSKSYPHNEVYKLFKQLAEKAGISPPPKLFLMDEDNSYVGFGKNFGGGVARVSRTGKGYVFLDPKIPMDEVAGIIAHELGHIKAKSNGKAAAVDLREHNDETLAETRRSETEADLFAVRLGQGPSLLKHFQNLPDNTEDVEHPARLERIANIMKAMKECAENPTLSSCSMESVKAPGVPNQKQRQPEGRIPR